ncbi:MAG: hypothetical protein ABH821_05300 [archaeon]
MRLIPKRIKRAVLVGFMGAAIGGFTASQHTAFEQHFNMLQNQMRKSIEMTHKVKGDPKPTIIFKKDALGTNYNKTTNTYIIGWNHIGAEALKTFRLQVPTTGFGKTAKGVKYGGVAGAGAYAFGAGALGVRRFKKRHVQKGSGSKK